MEEQEEIEELSLTDKIVETFKNKTEEYSKTLNAENFHYEELYLKGKKENGKAFAMSVLEFKDFFLKINYRVHAPMLLPSSTLEMRILFKGGKFPVEYSIYDLLNIIDETNFICYTIPYITTEELMEQALAHLMDCFTIYKLQIEELFHDKYKFAILEENIETQIQKTIGGKVFESGSIEYMIRMLEVYYLFDTSKFTTEIYTEEVLTGKYKKAVKHYKKKGEKATIYESRLAEFLWQRKEEYSFIPENLHTNKVVKKYQKVGIKGTFLSGLAFFILMPLWTFAYGLIYALTHFKISEGSLYMTNSEYPLLIIVGFVTAVVNMYFVRKILAKITYGKRFEEYNRIDAIQNPASTNNKMSKSFQFVIAAGIALSVLAANTYIKFNENNIILNTDMLQVNGTEIPYTMVDSVYKTEKIKGFKEYVEVDNYVIVLKDNTKIELYMYMTNEEFEQYVLPILNKKEIEIKNIDLLENIPKVEDKEVVE